MDSNTDDRDPEVPPEVSADELQEALQWLEELTGTAGNVPATEETIDSPFHGLVDDGAGDLPDWLREAPKEPVEQRLADDGEFESRLDWLAKMAERESIEELPTLEWRNLNDAASPPMADDAPQPTDDTLPPHFPSELLPVAMTPPEPLTAEAVLLVPEALPDEAPPPEPLTAEAVLLVPEALPDEAPPPDEAQVEVVATEEPAVPLPDEPDIEATIDGPAMPITPEALIDTLPPDEELPPIDDLDAAMAWIEELAASQDAPVEDVPSVADRALASKLLMEAGLSPDGLDRRLPDNELALGDLSLLEGNTPVNAFVAAEDFADTIVLVETMAADQGRSLPEEYQASATAGPPEASFAEAMAFLDELAADQEPLGAQTQPIDGTDVPLGKTVRFVTEELQLTEEPPDAWPIEDEQLAAPWLTEPEDVAETKVEISVGAAEEDESEPEAAIAELDALEREATGSPPTTDALEPDATLSVADAPWLEASVDEAPDEWREPEAKGSDAVAEFVPVAATATVLAAEGVAANGNVAATLEETLRALDALALPPGRSLTEFNASLPPAPARRDLPAAVEWLELALGISVPTAPPVPQWSDDELITQMPDDPDAVLAWLEQLAEEDTVGSSPQLSPTPETVADADHLPEIDASLDRMADAADPLIDELSAADLENMPDDPDAVMAWLEGLAGGRGETAAAPPVAPAQPERVVSPAPDQAPPPTGSRSRRRRGRKSPPVVAAEELAAVEPQVEAADVAAWEPIDEVTAPDVTPAPVTADAPLLGAANESTWEAATEVPALDVTTATAMPDAPVEAVNAPAWEEADEVAAAHLTVEGEESVAEALPEVAGEAPTVEAEGDAAALTWVEEMLAAPEATIEPPVEPATPLPLPAQPRRRGRKPKTAPTSVSTDDEPTAADAVIEPASDAAAETRPQPPTESEQAPPPAKPASWVDLLKPLK